MTLYILVWSFIVPYSESVYTEIPHSFTTMEACTKKLTDMNYYMTEGKGECISTKVKK